MQRMYNKYQQTQNEIGASVYKWVQYEKMHNIFASMAKASRAFGTYNDGNQVVPKGASILILININEDATQEISKSPQDQQNLDGTI